MGIKSVCFCFIFCVALAINGGTVKITDNGAVFETGDYSVRLSKDICWTIRELTWKGQRLMKDCTGAYNGTVLQTFVEESKKRDWVGTGHGHETVEAVKLLVDGKEQEFTPGALYSGSEFCFVKNSDLRILKLEATMIINASGILEKHKYTVVKTNPDIALLYGFMHSFDIDMKEWQVKMPNDKLLSGNFIGDAKNPFKDKMQWASLYNPLTKTGVVYVLTQKPAFDESRHFFWDRAHDRKLYFKATLTNIKKMEKGASFEYTAIVTGFEAPEDKWKEKAASEAGKSITN